MSVTLLRAYGGLATGAIISSDASTEASLVAQNLATYTGTGATPPTPASITAMAAAAAGTYCPATVTNIAMGSAAITGYETNGVAQTAYHINISEVFTPGWNTWTGASLLNGTGVGTNNNMVFLFDTNGKLIANSAVAGTLNAAGASVWENVAFTAAVTLPPGRYFVGICINGTTVTPRHVLTANGAEPRCADITAATSFANAIAVAQAGITVPTTFTTAVAPICRLYS